MEESMLARAEARMRATALVTAALLALTAGDRVFGASPGVAVPEPTLRSCEPIRVELCMGLGYNVTGMPNLVGHELQGDADFTLHTFSPLIQYGCSARLLFFLCSVYVPMCTEKVLQPIGPCRGLCESVRSRCYPVLQGFGFPWPAALNCSKFPTENNHEHMCMEGPGDEGGLHSPSVTEPRIPILLPTKTPLTTRNPVAGQCLKLYRPELYVYVNRTDRCAARCEADVLFSQDDKRLAEVWLTVWAGLCFVSSLVTLLSFLVDSGRFRYPERPVAFLALCYNLASVGWGVRAAAGRSAVACHVAPSAPFPGAPAPLLILSHDGLANANCAVVFLLLYYFGMAAAVWWVVLAAGWYLAAGRRVPPERLARHSSFGHLAAWGLPAAQTVAVLVLRDVDADELTGACFVGNQSSLSLLVFVLLPHLVYLTLGAGFLLAGLVALMRMPPKSRSPPPQPPRPLLPQTSSKAQSAAAAAAQHEALIARVGVLGALYTVPALCVVASLFYEYSSRDDWLMQPLSGDPPAKPSLWVFILRLFMSLVVGVTSAAWVWSSKTLKSWQRLVQRLLGPPPRKVVDIPAVPLTPMSRGSSRGGAHNYVLAAPLQAPSLAPTPGGKFHHTHTHHHHHHHPRLPVPHHKSHHRAPKQPAGSETTV
ncbi:hypothetical protein B566_EDAN014059 [Ephemera danica]|nr:hypothetical protein B566_EDAN014059 [Ephemera danica]